MGNDIVDLSLPDSSKKYLSRRFLERVFTTTEQFYIEKAANKDKVLWSIWAAKEAAFKAIKKHDPSLIFAHARFFIPRKTLSALSNFHKRENFFGILRYENLSLLIKWQWYWNVVNCIAIFPSFSHCHSHEGENPFEVDSHLRGNNTFFRKKIKFNLFKIDQLNINVQHYFSKAELSSIHSPESLMTRFYAKKFLDRLGFKDIEIIRSNANPPILRSQGKELTDYEISLSHDGNWGSIAIGGSF